MKLTIVRLLPLRLPRTPFLLEFLLTAVRECIEHRPILGSITLRARRRILARRGPPAGWPNRVTERTCVWLARDVNIYCAILSQASNAHRARCYERGSVRVNETPKQLIEAYLRKHVGRYVQRTPNAAQFIGQGSLDEIDWASVADWFLGHRIHPSDWTGC